MVSPNPYAAPIADSPLQLRGNGSCPQCGGQDVHQPKFTWWGGALGPKLFKHTVCRSCKFGFDWQTRQGNRKRIVVYVVAVNTVTLLAFGAYAYFLL